MKLSKLFKMLTALGILGSLFLSSSSYGMFPTLYILGEENGRPILSLTQIKQTASQSKKEWRKFLERFPTMTAEEKVKLPGKVTKYDIGCAPERFEKTFDYFFNNVGNPVTFRSGKKVRLVPVRGGRGDFIEWRCGPDLSQKRFEPKDFLQMCVSFR
ncbi:MAG TPA: hypothetical protein PLY23_09205 [Alphaproteobacteria bacterium]|nr:hypothetical protein [Alphaproteobacteria bacterium]HQS94782.1 hypothetical protein [Alphaproteobacteria bacterium]